MKNFVRTTNKCQILTAIVFFFLGSVITFFYQQNLLNNQTKQAKYLVSDSRELFKTQHSLTSSCFEAYDLLTECAFNNQPECDPFEFVERIKEQVVVRDEAFESIRDITKSIEATVSRNNW